MPGFIGQTAEGVVVLQDNDPRTEGATYETVTFTSEDEAIAAVAQFPNDPLRCNVLLIAPGTTRIVCSVDPGSGEPFTLAVDVEAQLPPPGEAVPGGSTFTLGEFVEQPLA
jgi:hypothetical protein